MRLFGRGLLLTFTEVAPEEEADFNEWYNREHLDERIDLPGFRRARRYKAVDASIKYLSTYEALEADAIGSARYLEVLKHQTDWSRRVMGRFTKWHRMSCRVVADETHGMGAAMTLVRFFPRADATGELTRWLGREALPAISRAAGVVGAVAIAVDLAVDARLTRGLGQIPKPDQQSEWGVLVEGTDLAATLAAARQNLASHLAATAIAGTTPVFETWQLMFANMRLSDTEKA